MYREKHIGVLPVNLCGCERKRMPNDFLFSFLFFSRFVDVVFINRKDNLLFI